MRLTFVGVGEAFDPGLPTTSLHLDAVHPGGGTTRLLLDCGFTAAHAYWRSVEHPEELDAVWISHLHGDHTFGLPALLLKLWEIGRERPLMLAGPPGLAERVVAIRDLAYGSLGRRMAYHLEFHELEPGQGLDVGGMRLDTALQDHSSTCLAVRVREAEPTQSGGLFYSGDGRPTAETLELARGAEIIVHEAYELDGETPGHGNVAGVIAFARQAGAATLAVVHVRASVRAAKGAAIRALLAKQTDMRALLPEPGDVLDLA